MKNKFLIFALTCIYAMPVSAAQLVKDGKPAGRFILSKVPAAAESFATNDVRDWIEKITCAKVPIVTEPGKESNLKIFFGTDHASDFKDDLQDLKGNDGFAVCRKGNHVCVFGSRPRGTLYGLYALLEKNSDLIFAPTSR